MKREDYENVEKIVDGLTEKILGKREDLEGREEKIMGG